MVYKEKFSYRKVAELLVTVAFYGVVIYLIRAAIQGQTVQFLGLIKSAVPYFFGSYWFIKTYLILYLLAPFLNKGLIRLDINGYRRLLLTQILLFSVWYSVGLSAPLIDDGYGIINFVTLYLIGGYIRRFSDECAVLRWFNSLRSFFAYLICVLMTAFVSIFINPFGYAFCTSIFASAFLFLAFQKLPERETKWINTLSSKAFDVFFVHGAWIFNLLGIQAVAASWLVAPHMILTLVICYLIGFISGCIRSVVMKATVDKLLDKWDAMNKSFTV